MQIPICARLLPTVLTGFRMIVYYALLEFIFGVLVIRLPGMFNGVRNGSDLEVVRQMLFRPCIFAARLRCNVLLITKSRDSMR